MKDNFQREISYLRVSITEKCNLRCTYCMGDNEKEPAKTGLEGRKNYLFACGEEENKQDMSPEKIQEIVEAAVYCGIKKVRITGGEPLLRLDVTEICERIHKIEGIQDLTLTTNGVFLEKYAAGLKKAGVSRVNISLDTLDPEKYRKITRQGDIRKVLRGIEAAEQEGLLPIKLNVVLLKDINDGEIRQFAELTRERAIEVRFIELMPIGVSRGQEKERYLDGRAVLEAVPQLFPVEDSGVARMYMMPHGIGKVGLISPVSRHFCPSCNRIRLTSDGKLKPCLHSEEETDVLMLSGERLKAAIAGAIRNKPSEHGDFTLGAESMSIRNMNQIGG